MISNEKLFSGLLYTAVAMAVTVAGGYVYSHFFEELADSSRIISQSHQLQSEITTVCGQYCLFFLLRRCSNETYFQIIHLFTDNKASNDIMVCQYVNHYFDLNTEVQDKRFFNQVAKMFTELK